MTISCPSGAVATSLVGNASGTNVNTLGLICKPVTLGSYVVAFGAQTQTQLADAEQTQNFELDCPAGSVITGVAGNTVPYFSDNVVSNIAIQCVPLFGSAITGVGPVNNQSSQPFTLPCPSGRVVTGLYVQQGDFVNGVGLTCQ